MMRFDGYRRFLLAAMAGFVMSGLGAAPAWSQETVNVGVLRFVSSGGFYLAHERGYFQDEGLDVQIKYFEAAQPIAVAVTSGDVDFGITAFTAGLFNLAGKGGIKVIAAQAKEEKGFEGNAILASNAAYEAGFTSLKDFPGKTLAITQTGSSFHYQIGQIAAAEGFDLSEVELKPLQSLPNMVAALKTNQVDATIIAPHIAKPIIDAGEAKLLGWYSDVDSYQFGALFTAPDVIGERRETVERFVRAYQRGMSDYAEAFLTRENGNRVFGDVADDAAALIAKHVYPSDEESVGVAKVKASSTYVDSAARLDVQDIYNQIDWFKAQGLVDASVEPKVLFDLSFVDGHTNVPAE